MGQSKKDLKKAKARADAAAGIAPHDPKADKRKAQAVCTICKQTFTVTARNVEAKAHIDSKHPGQWATCFPGITAPA
eukprot:TRINITY_DN20126_c0_g1_i1.p1 TRINITY_DN20126_c0_g1~~TRINITY_DN20126_c0_g1_i1.p1  ORF type:complete len:77 (-),score=27.37 TRINITY_DN20126_c0_g1_i1:82-312(-)